MNIIAPLRSDYANPEAIPADQPALLMRRQVRLGCAAALMQADLWAFLLALAGAALLSRLAGSQILSFQSLDSASRLWAAFGTDLVLLGAVMLSFAHHAHYGRRIPFWGELRDVVIASSIALLCSGFVQFSLQRHDSRLLLGLTWLLFPVMVIATRMLVRKLLRGAGLWQLPIVVVGGGEVALQAKQALLSEHGLGYSIAGTVHPAEMGPWPEPGRWRKILAQTRAELLVLALDPADPDNREITESLVRERIPFAVVPQLDGLPVLGFAQTPFFSHDTIMFTYRNNLEQPFARITKIAFDLLLASLMLLVLTPLLLLLAALVRLDGGPVLFAHTRIGARGHEFPCFKFRSMVPNSDAVLHALLASDPAAAAEWQATQKLRNDPRVTRVGRLLRATSLDEVPQLFNVLRLEMSLVGPRPIVRAEVPRYGCDITYYYETRPGLTGLWQVSGRSDTGYTQRVQLDTWYVKNWTIWHDLAILAKTIPAVLARRGAV